MEPAEAVLRFLAGVGPGSEAEFYLRLFRGRAKESFAAIVFDPEAWQENAEGVALDLRLLAMLALTPVVVLGFYHPAQADSYARVLEEKLQAMGVASRSFASDVPRRDIAAAASGNAIPLLRLQQAAQPAREDELTRALTALGTHKLIFLRNAGGLSVDGQRLSVVNLSEEWSELMARSELDTTQTRILHYARAVTGALQARAVTGAGTPAPQEHELLVTITSPLNLLHELFTVKGAGTLLQRGARIQHHAGLDDVDRTRLAQLLEDSFGKPLRSNALSQAFTHTYLEVRFRGAALLTDTPLGSYLSKFAVTRQAQGEGIGRDLWQVMRRDHPQLFWRARPNNPIRSFYERQCDTRVKADAWEVYSIGIEPQRIPALVAHALAQPVDF